MAGVIDLQPAGIVVVASGLRLQGRPVAHQDDAHVTVGHFPQEIHCPFDGLLRAVVSAHGVQGYTHCRRPVRFAVAK